MQPAGVLVLASEDMLPAGVSVLSSLDRGYCWDSYPFMEVTLSHCLRGAAPELGIIKGSRTIQVTPHAGFPLAAANLSSVPGWGGVASRCPYSSGLPLPLAFTLDLSFCIWNSSSKYSHRYTQPYICSPVSRLRWFPCCSTARSTSLQLYLWVNFQRWSCDIYSFSLIFFLVGGHIWYCSKVIPDCTHGSFLVEPYELLEIEPRLAMHKASALPLYPLPSTVSILLLLETLWCWR